MVLLCFQKYNVQHKNRSFAEITCSKIDFLQHKISVIQSMSTLEQFTLIWSLQWIFSWIKIKNERSRIYWLLVYFMSMNITKNESFIYVTDYGCMKLFLCQYGMLNCIWLSHWYCFCVCFQRLHFYHICCDEWLVFTSFSYCAVPA